MFCPSCGHDNLESAAHCAACGTSLSSGALPPPPGPAWGSQPAYGHPGGHAEPRPENHLVWAIVTTLLCCLPAGVVSIVYAAQVDSKHNAGDYAGARDASEKAKLWAMVSAGISAAVLVGYFILVAIALVAENA